MLSFLPVSNGEKLVPYGVGERGKRRQIRLPHFDKQFTAVWGWLVPKKRKKKLVWNFEIYQPPPASWQVTSSKFQLFFDVRSENFPLLVKSSHWPNLWRVEKDAYLDRFRYASCRHRKRKSRFLVKTFIGFRGKEVDWAGDPLGCGPPKYLICLIRDVLARRNHCQRFSGPRIVSKYTPFPHKFYSSWSTPNVNTVYRVPSSVLHLFIHFSFIITF